MKKITNFIVFIILISCFCTAFADEYNEKIRFRNVEWGSPYSDTVKALPDGVKMYGLENREYWYSVSDRMFDTDLSLDYKYKAELGCYCYAQSSSLENIKVAGYDIAQIYLYFVYLTGDDGLLIKDGDHTSLINAFYKIEPKNPDAAYEDLTNKLISLYGDVDYHQEKTPYTSYEQNLWYGAEGTMVSLVRHDSSSSHEIFIKYGYSDGDDIIDKAYEAVVLQEILEAASNTDGL